MVLLLRERDARRVDRGSCRDHSEYETPINHELVPFGKWLCTDNVDATRSALSFALNP
jgi:hypothetical protein